MTPTLSLFDTLVSALTATDCDPQIAGLEFDPDMHEIVGEVPMAVRNLHNIVGKLTLEQEAMLADATDQESYDRILPQLKANKHLFDHLDPLRWALLREAFPTLDSDCGLTILNDWQVARNIVSEESSMASAFLQGLLGGGTHVIIAGFGRRSRH